ncbi:MAG: HAD family hydrolase [Rhodospirillales bacterium]|nr:HAD family hydrolase [Rhodospirillales bacterium]
MIGAPTGLVIFDCDGVLVDSEPISAAALADELTKAGFATTAEECLLRYLGLSRDCVDALIEARWGRPLPDGFRERLRERDYAAFRKHLQATPGVEAMLEAMTAARCVASSGSLEKLDVTLSATGLLRYFAPNVFSAEQVARGKPAPDLFLYAAERMGARPQECIVVEDSVAGIQAARSARMRVIGYAGGGHADNAYARRLAEAGATITVRRMDQLGALLP